MLIIGNVHSHLLEFISNQLHLILFSLLKMAFERSTQVVKTTHDKRTVKRCWIHWGNVQHEDRWIHCPTSFWNNFITSSVSWKPNFLHCIILLSIAVSRNSSMLSPFERKLSKQIRLTLIVTYIALKSSVVHLKYLRFSNYFIHTMENML